MIHLKGFRFTNDLNEIGNLATNRVNLVFVAMKSFLLLALMSSENRGGHICHRVVACTNPGGLENALFVKEIEKMRLARSP